MVEERGPAASSLHLSLAGLATMGQVLCAELPLHVSPGSPDIIVMSAYPFFFYEDLRI